MSGRVGYPHREPEQLTVPVSFQLHGQQVGTEAAVWVYEPSAASFRSRPSIASEDSRPSPVSSRHNRASSLSAPRILMVHGFRGDHHGMQLIADALPEFAVWVPDLPGFGITAPLHTPAGERVEHTVEVYAEFVEALAGQLGLGEGDTLLGHSFGTIVCAAHLAQHGRGWSRLVLSAPISDSVFRGRLLPGAAVVEAYYRLCRLLPESAADAVLRSAAVLQVMNLTLGAGWDAGLRAFVEDQHRRFFGRYSDRQTLLEAYHASSRHTVADYAGQLRLPVLLVPGAKDNMSTPPGLRALRGTLPDGRLEVIRGSGHLIHYEKPAQLARAVRRFLS